MFYDIIHKAITFDRNDKGGICLLRLDKYLCDVRNLSRQEARALIRAGRVTADGAAEKRPEAKVDPVRQTICLDGAPLLWARHRYYMLDKPTGVVTATEDRAQKTVLDLFPPALRRDFAPAGRLDKDTTGLLLLSTDGAWIHQIISPRGHVEKVYLAETEGTPAEADAETFAQGLTLRDGTVCRPAKLEILAPGLCRVTVTEGKYHLVRRMLAAVGTPVTALRRVRVGGLALDETLGPGGFRALKEQEIRAALMNKSTKN